jgi:hypothetical protein
LVVATACAFITRVTLVALSRFSVAIYMLAISVQASPEWGWPHGF